MREYVGVLEVRCPHCGAAAGKPCRNKTGELERPHLTRQDEAGEMQHRVRTWQRGTVPYEALGQKQP